MLSNLEWPFHASRVISAVAELVVMCCSHGDGQPADRDRGGHDRLSRAASGTGRSSPGSSSHGAASDSTVTSDPATTSTSSQRERDKKPVGMLIRGFPVRSSNSSVRDGLFHEYKKYGKVTSVHIMGTGDDRHAIVSFKKSVTVLLSVSLELSVCLSVCQ